MIVNGIETEDIAEMTDEEKTNKFTSLGLDLNSSKAKMYLAVGLTANESCLMIFPFQTFG
jgi:hypothetical protein